MMRCFFFFSSRRRHTRWPRDWSSDVCSSDLVGEELLVIAEGEVRVVAGGTEIARRRRGDYVGEMAVLDGEPRSASLIATGEVRALRVGRREFESIMRERPETSLAMLAVLTRRLREMMKSAAASGR